MTILLFGVSNVGKTASGEKLAQRLGYRFYDLDEVIKEVLQTTLEKFMTDYPFQYERHQLKGRILKGLVVEPSENRVVAVSPIFYSRWFNPLLKLGHVNAIELQDSVENIFERLVFSDENDVVYKDDAYKNEHWVHYMKEIHDDIVFSKRVFSKIEHKFFIDNRSVDQVVDGLMEMLGNSVNLSCAEKKRNLQETQE